MEEDKVSEKDANERNRPFNDLERNAVYVCEHGYAVSKNRSENVVDVVDKITRQANEHGVIEIHLKAKKQCRKRE